LSFGLHDLLELFLDLAADGWIARQKDEAGAVLARGGEIDARGFRHLGKELVRHLDENARAVAGVDLGTRGAAVVEVAQHLERVRHDLVGLATVHIDHEAHAARLVLEPRIVEALFGRQSGGANRRVGGLRDFAGAAVGFGGRRGVHGI
jgi:hypothetical protein